MEEGIHLHCLNCINIKKCTAAQQRCFQCAIVPCHLDCGSIFHECKKEEHQLLCQNERVSCYNAAYGCPCVMQRKYLAKHLGVCPASVIHCTMEWNRTYLNPKSVKILQKCLEMLKNQPQLDIALTLRDLRKLPPVCRNSNKHGGYRLSDKVDEPESMTDNPLDNNGWCKKGYNNTNDYNNLYHRFKVLESYMNYLSQNESDTVMAQNDVMEITDHEECKCCEIYSDQESDECFCDTPEEIWAPPKKCTKDAKAEEKSEMETLSFSEIIVRAITSSPTRYLGLGGTCCMWVSRSIEPKLTFLCCQEFRRDEYPWHYKNVHSEIYSGLNGWLQERCPLAQYGCTFSRKGLNPKPEGSIIVYNKILESLGIAINPYEPQNKSELKCNGNFVVDNSDEMSDNQSIVITQLPFEVLKHIAQFLDSFSLANLALTSCLMREVCRSLLVDHGIVALKWEKHVENDIVSWKTKAKKWFFSSHFSPIRDWIFDDSNNMSNHLKTCTYFNRNRKTDPYYYPMGLKPNACVYQMLKTSVTKMGYSSENVSTKL